MDYNDGDDNDNPLPSHLISLQYKRKNNNKGGWAGDELEMQHQMKQLRDIDCNAKNTTTAVDLSQFRNEEVGVGYQARGVIRQRGAKNGPSGSNGGGNSLNIIDMTQRVKSEKDDDSGDGNKSHRKKKKRYKKKSKKRKHKHQSDDDSDDNDRDADRDGDRSSSSSDHKKSKRKKRKKQRQSEKSINEKESVSSPKDDKYALLQKYLKCDAIRTFCKEIEKIVAEASK